MLIPKKGLCSCCQSLVRCLNGITDTRNAEDTALHFLLVTQMHGLFSLSIEENDRPQTVADLSFQRIDQNNCPCSQNLVSGLGKRAHCSGTGTIVAVVCKNN